MTKEGGKRGVYERVRGAVVYLRPLFTLLLNLTQLNSLTG